MSNTQRTYTVTAESIAHTGAAVCTGGPEPIHVHGMLPGETAIVDVQRKHKILLGEIREFVAISPHRKAPEELHYMSCSPWQVAQYPAQAAMKQEMLAELYGFYPDAPPVTLTPAEQYYGYRTKVEFSFVQRDATGSEIPLSLAYHIRNAGKARIAIDGCELLHDHTNEVAHAILLKLREQKLTTYELKALTIRESTTSGKCIAILYVKDKELAKFDLSDIPNLAGFQVWYSTHKSPATVPTTLIWKEGDELLHEVIDHVSLAYPWDGFFQNNIPVFTKAVRRMREFVKADAHILELYSGVGTIGLLLAPKAASVHGVEISASSVLLAKENALAAGITNYTCECLPAEQIDEKLLAQYDTLVLDPPRAGLHPKLTKHIQEAKPETIIYLSCNPESQARDYSVLAEGYALMHVEGFDFYPQTPHCECLIVMKRK